MDSYIWAFIFEILVFDLLGIILISLMSKKLKLNRWYTLVIYTIALLAIGPLITIRFDLIPAIITLFSIYLFIKGQNKAAWTVLAIGTFTKLYPAILVPIFLIHLLQQHQKGKAIAGMAAFAITSAIIILPVLIMSPEGLWQSFAYHAQRGLQIESTYASFLELGYAFKFIKLDFVYNFGSWHLVSQLADIFAKASFAVTLLCLVAVYWFYYKENKSLAKSISDQSIRMNSEGLLINYSIVIIIVFILTTKVFSPQFIIWIYPFIPLTMGRWGTVSALMFIMVGLMTFFVFPEYYESIRTGYLPVIIMLVLRNIAMILMAFLIAASGFNNLARKDSSFYLSVNK
jgi:uncharacterized membrane protein